ncbi:MqnA/MqnD/SBP family protein [Liberiplasma polymorphum]|uniref:MqnA/MqnD/SBP family protein n=1 Tax=Liberiplasma polymorphum TaxID=3374570 RepID=UPI003772F0C8
MKRISNVLLLILVFSLLGCSNESNADSITVIVPNGSTSIAQAYLEYTLKDSDIYDYNVLRVSGPEPLIAAFVNEEFDFIIAPINLGAKLINTGANYTFLATITEGNLLLASRKPLLSIHDLSGKHIIAFGQNNTPDIVLQSILSAINFNSSPTIEYVGNTQATLAELLRSEDSIVLISEPFVSMSNNHLEEVFLIDLNQVWQELLELPSFPQAGLFVKNDVSPHLIEQYMQLFEESIIFANTYPNLLAHYCNELSYPFDSNIISHSIERSGLVFNPALDAKESVEAYFNFILDKNPDLIHNKLPNESFYYNKVKE